MKKFKTTLVSGWKGPQEESTEAGIDLRSDQVSLNFIQLDLESLHGCSLQNISPKKVCLYQSHSWQSIIHLTCLLLPACLSQLPAVLTSLMLRGEMASTDIYLLSQEQNALRIVCFSVPRDVLFTSASPAMKAEGFASCSSGEESKRD